MNFLKRIGLVIIYTVIGAVILSTPSIASFYGLFVKWELIEQPPEKAAEILEIDYVKSDTGNIYHLHYDKECKAGCWERVEQVPTKLGYYVLPIDACDTFPFLPFTTGFVDHKKACIAWGAGTNMTAQSIRNDGVIYSWNHRLTELTFLTPLMFKIAGALLGFLFGLLRVSQLRNSGQVEPLIENNVVQ